VTRSRRAEGTLVGDRDGDGGDAAPRDTAVAPPAEAAPAGGDASSEEGASAGSTGEPDDARDPAARRRDRAAGVAVAAALALPIVIAAAAVRTPRWYPQVDLAQIEMRVRDVFSSHPPTLGLGGRIYGINNTQGAHPGPVSFYLLAPVYRLLGGTSWALQVSGAVLNVAVLAGTLWATSRRWGLRGVLLVGAALAFLLQLYGTQLLVYPWNPFMPVLFWMLFLVCVWGVLCGDLPLLPIAVVAGTLCAQTHIPYVGLVGGLLLVVVVSLVRQHRRAAGDDGARRRLRRWAGGSALLGALLWLPVVIQQVGGNPGNLSIIWDGVIHKRDPAVGYGQGWSILLRHLDVVRLLGAGGKSSAWIGGALLAAWVAAVVVAVRRGERDLTALHLVVGVALALGLVDAANILGIPWYYLSLWAYGTAALAAVATVATAARAAGPALTARGDGRWRRLAWVPTTALVVAIAVPLALVVRDAPATDVSEKEVSDVFAQVIGPTIAAIEDGTVPGGPDATILVSWSDPIALGGPGYSMILELERRGYDAGAWDTFHLAVRDHRVVDVDEADVELHVAYGAASVDQARTHPGAREIAFVDPRTDDQRAEYVALRAQVVDGLVAAGLDEAVPDIDLNLMGLATRTDFPADLAAPLEAMGRMPQPMAVLVWEPGT
jgi:hypothetical protein